MGLDWLTALCADTVPKLAWTDSRFTASGRYWIILRPCAATLPPGKNPEDDSRLGTPPTSLQATALQLLGMRTTMPER